MHEFGAVRAVFEAIEAAASDAGANRVEKVTMSIGPDSHLGGGRLEDLLALLAPGRVLEGAALIVGGDESIGDGVRVESVVVSRTGSV